MPELTENQRTWLHAMYATEYAWTMHYVSYLRSAAEGTTSASRRKAFTAEADEREGYAHHLAALRDADEPKESTEQKEEECTSCPTPAPSA